MFAEQFVIPERPVLSSDLFVSCLYAPPVDWFEALSIATDLSPNYRYMDAMLMAMLDADAVAVLMVKHLLAWLPHSIREDGAVWRNADEWSAYCGVSSSQVYSAARRKRLEGIGFTIWNEKAMGDKQLHFKLDPAYFTARIAKVLGVPARQIHELVWLKRDDPKVGSGEFKVGSGFGEVGSVEIKNPLTDKTTTKTTKKTTSTKALVGSLINLSSVDEILEGLVTGGLMTLVDRVAFKDVSRTDLIDCLSSLEVATSVKHPQKYLRASLKARQLDAEKSRLMVSPPAEQQAEPLDKVPTKFLPKSETIPNWWGGFMGQMEGQFNLDWWIFARRLEFAGEGDGVVRLRRPADVAEKIFLQFKRNIEAILRMCRGEVVTVEYVV